MPRDLLIAEPSICTMPWLSSAVNGSLKSTMPHVVQHLGEEPRVQQVQDRVRHAADVLRRPAATLRPVRVERHVVAMRREVAQEVPGRVDEGVHRVGVALRGPPHDGHATLTQSVAPPSGDVPLGLRSRPVESGGSTTAAGRRARGTSPHAGQWTIGIGVPQ